MGRVSEAEAVGHLRIAMVARALPRPDYAGGVSGQVHLLATALVRRGHRVTVYALNGPPNETGYDYRQITLPSSIARHPAAALYLFPWFVARRRIDDCDIVHTHGDDHFLRSPAPVVRTFYGHSRAEARHSTTLRHHLYHMSMTLPEYLSERRATALVAISTSTRRALARPAVVIPCGYDPTVFFPSGEKSASPSILFVGDLGTRKRAELLLKAFTDIVRPATPAAELWMVTTAPVSREGVRWFGRLPASALGDLYRQAWVFCLPSRYEGFGVPYIEAMACGTPVVTTANGGAEEVLDGGRYGLLVKDEELGDALLDLLTDERVRLALAASAVARAKAYDIGRIAEQYETLYRSVLGSDPAVLREES
ncbi:MAG: glycosyltransferase family 4 protein [candidate division NC10 bacterium]|nr:glycosyltransferase family 4 protein [candidate division NC10 bacterium]